MKNALLIVLAVMLAGCSLVNPTRLDVDDLIVSWETTPFVSDRQRTTVTASVSDGLEMDYYISAMSGPDTLWTTSGSGQVSIVLEHIWLTVDAATFSYRFKAYAPHYPGVPPIIREGIYRP